MWHHEVLRRRGVVSQDRRVAVAGWREPGAASSERAVDAVDDAYVASVVVVVVVVVSVVAVVVVVVVVWLVVGLV